MKTRTLFFFIVIITTSFFLVHRFLTLPISFFQNATSFAVYPFLKAQQVVVAPIKRLLEKKKEYHELQQLFAQTFAEKEQLQAQNIALHAELQFAQDTKELVAFANQYQLSQYCLGQILLRQFTDAGHYFLIDGGSNKGIKVDMIAVWQNVIIGRVVEVYPFYSKVILVTDRSCKVACYCAKTGAYGIHEGINKDMQTMLNYVSHLQKIEQDDLLLSSGEGLVFPRGFALGKVQGFSHDGVQYHVSVAPLIDLRKIQYCYLMQKGA